MYGKNISQLKAEMDVAMGGRAAEEIIFGLEKVTTGMLLDVAVLGSGGTAVFYFSQSLSDLHGRGRTDKNSS